jgi:hypothetical protein
VSILDQIKEKARELRDLEQERTNLEERLTAVGRRIEAIRHADLPDLMNEAGCSSFTLEAEGNNPPFEVTKRPFYSANIAAKWPDNKRRKAFDAVSEHGGSDLIKTTVTFTFGKGQVKQAMKLADDHRLLQPEVKESIHFASLTSWLKERVEAGKPVPDLDLIGGRIGQIVEPKKVR